MSSGSCTDLIEVGINQTVLIEQKKTNRGSTGRKRLCIDVK